MTTQYTFTDPAKLYADIEPSKQHQPEPGLDAELTPKAALGEDTYVEAGNRLDTETGRLLADVADRTCDLWRRADSGMWELSELEHYTSSKMGC